MNAEQRAKLLRERFKARKPSSAILATRTVKGAKWWVCYGSGEIAHGKTAFGPLEREHWRKDWIAESDPKAAIIPAHKRTARVSPLTAMTPKLLAKSAAYRAKRYIAAPKRALSCQARYNGLQALAL